MRREKDFRQVPYVFQQTVPVAPIERTTPGDKVGQIREVEGTDTSYIPRSSVETYLFHGRGLGMVFSYIENAGLPKTLLDIGTGDAQALSEMARLRDDFSFIGTALMPREEFETVPPNVSIHITDGETLEGVADDSIGAILSFQAIGFSDNPEEVAQSMNRVLAPGGVIKASFRRANGSYPDDWDQKYDAWGYNTHVAFSNALSELGYQIAILETDGDDVMAAIKPDGKDNDFLQDIAAGRYTQAMGPWGILAGDNLSYTTREDPIEVFGETLLEQTKGNEATEEDAANVLATVKTLCDPQIASEHFGRYTRLIDTSTGQQITVLYNPASATGFGDSYVDQQIASIQGYRNSRSFKHPEGYKVPGKFKTTDSIYIDEEGKVKLRRCVYYDGPFDSRAGSMAASKDATKDEVKEALRIVNDAVHRQE